MLSWINVTIKCEFRSPLPDIVELQIVNKDVPCGEDFDHFTRVGFFITLKWKSVLFPQVYGATGDSSMGMSNV